MTGNRSAAEDHSRGSRDSREFRDFPDASAVAWEQARASAHAAGSAAPLGPVEVGLYDADCDGRVLAEDVVALTDLPAFASSSIDGFAVRGPGPWQVVGAVPAGGGSVPIGRDGAALRIATGAMVPADTEAILRVEEAGILPGGRIDGRPRSRREWRAQGEQARRGTLLVPSGSTVTPAVLGVAASAGYDRLLVRPRPRLTLVLLGAEVATSGLAGEGRLRDAIGPQLPTWARRLGFEVRTVLGPVPDDAAALRAALRRAVDSDADVIATAGGTMYGPTDLLRPTLGEFEAEYLVPSVRARPGRAMLLARLRVGAFHHGDDDHEAGPDGTRAAGRQDDARAVLLVAMPGRPQPALLTLLTLAVPAAAGMTGRRLPELPGVLLGAPIAGRRGQTRLAPVRLDADGRAFPLEQDRPAPGPSSVTPASAGVTAGAAGFVVIAPGADADAGERVPLLALPLKAGEQAGTP